VELPLAIPLGEVAMALMAGNTVVLKPSELTPLVGLKIGEIFEKAGCRKMFCKSLRVMDEQARRWSNRRPTRLCSREA
jgi:acyl-CoA reductase-like NAD-dependent aldehyde dehydrogenase